MSEDSRMTITEFLEARIAEDEAAVRAAIDPEKPGTHWQWVTTETDTVVAPGDTLEALNYQPISLRSVEEFPSSAGMLPAFIIHQVSEMQDGAGDHIAMWDPARVLAECAAKRAVIGLHDGYSHSTEDGAVDGWCALNAVLKDLAAIYKDHPDYRQEWAL